MRSSGWSAYVCSSDLAGGARKPGRSERCPEHRRYPGRSRRRTGASVALGENVPFAVGRRDPSCALCRGRKDTGARCHLSVRSTTKLCAHPAPDDGDQPSRDERTYGGSPGRRQRGERSPERKSVVSGKSVSVRVELGGRRSTKKKTKKDNNNN